MDAPLLKDILLIFALAIAVLLVCYKIRVATTVGFILTGILAGPHGLGLISALEEVEILAEIGVILLLFTIGLEFSLQNLLRIKRFVLLGGALQIGFTAAAVFLLSRQVVGLGSAQSLFVGFLICLSSTAIVLRLLQERAEVESPHGQATLAILIFQDIAVVPMMLLLPMLAGMESQGTKEFFLMAGKGMGFLILILAGAKWVVPHVLYHVAKTRSRELFLLSILVICFSVAFLSHALGLSLALGAFMAGLIISETEFSHETLGNVIPFRHAFTSLFFVSIGMLLDVGFLFEQPVRIALVATSVMILKSLLAGLTVLLLGFPLRTGILAGLALCQVGEFSFILFMRGAQLGLLGSDFYQLFLDTSVLTMGLTPFVIAFSPRLGNAVLQLSLPERLRSGLFGKGTLKTPRQEAGLKDHLVVVGYGLNGRNLARAARLTGIPYVVVEINPQTVKEERRKGEPLYYGDASQESVLEHLGIRRARMMVIVISDPLATRRTTAIARRMNPALFILVRTRFLAEMRSLQELGATEVIPEEFETSIEIFSRVLSKYLVPRDDIERLIAQARADGYEMLRTRTKTGVSLPELKQNLPDLDISAVRIEKGSPGDGKSIGEIGLRRRYGVTVLAIRRDTEVFSNPEAATVLRAEDLLILLGNPALVIGACSVFRSGAPPERVACPAE